MVEAVDCVLRILRVLEDIIMFFGPVEGGSSNCLNSTETIDGILDFLSSEISI